MSDVAPYNFLRKLRYTPARDLIRGRISGRLDVKGTIARSNLPVSAEELVARIVKRTRLWLSEKVEVADELIAHFADGIESGVSVETLIEKFGNERKAAKLIRCAKKRNRPLPWHILRALGWIITVMLAIYGFLAARFFLGHPSPKVNYVAAINRPLLAVPQEQRAWPIYRKAILGMGSRVYSKEREDRLVEVFDARPGSEHWPKVGPWLAAHAKVIELVREAAAKPRMGFIYGKHGSISDEELYPGLAAAAAENAALWSILLPLLNDVTELSNALTTDARFAREQGDSARVMLDIEALLNLSQQLCRDGDFMVIDMRGMRTWAVALDVAGQSVVHEKLKLSDEELKKLAHFFSRPRVAGDFLKLSGERLMFADAVQRAYTDNGKGDGHLTLQGHRFLQQLRAGRQREWKGGYGAVADEYKEIATAPALAASRREMMQAYEKLIDIAESNFARPMREADWGTYHLSMYSTGLQMSFDPLEQLVKGWRHNAQGWAERWLGQRDGMVVAIALELHRRKFGEYPKTLDALAPQFLPQVPADRITGEAVKYRLVNGKPLIYSVGDDRKDDGGKVPVRAMNKPDRWAAAMWNQEKPADGDWVLYSPLGEKDQ